MNITADEVQVAVDELREMGAIVEVQGSGRVPVPASDVRVAGRGQGRIGGDGDPPLRGEQTVGELRAAARMEPIAGLPELKPILQSLMAKNLVLSLTPEGRDRWSAITCTKIASWRTQGPHGDLHASARRTRGRFASHAPGGGV